MPEQRAFVLWTNAPEEDGYLRHVLELTVSLDELNAREDFCQFYVDTEYHHGILDVYGDEEYEGCATDVEPEEAEAFVDRFATFLAERGLLLRRLAPTLSED